MSLEDIIDKYTKQEEHYNTGRIAPASSARIAIEKTKQEEHYNRGDERLLPADRRAGRDSTKQEEHYNYPRHITLNHPRRLTHLHRPNKKNTTTEVLRGVEDVHYPAPARDQTRRTLQHYSF